MSSRLDALLASATRVEVAYEEVSPNLVANVRRALGAIALASAAVAGALPVEALAQESTPTREVAVIRALFGRAGVPEFISVNPDSIAAKAEERPAAAYFEMFVDGERTCELQFTKHWEQHPMMRLLANTAGIAPDDFFTFAVAHEAQHCVTYSATTEALLAPAADGAIVLDAVGGNAEVLRAGVPAQKREALVAAISLLGSSESALRGEMICDVMGVLAVQQKQQREGRGDGLTAAQLRSLAGARAASDREHHTHPALLHLADLVEKSGKLDVDTEDPEAMSAFAYGVVSQVASPAKEGVSQATRTVSQWRRDGLSGALVTLIKAAGAYEGLGHLSEDAIQKHLKSELQLALDGVQRSTEKFSPVHLSPMTMADRMAWTEKTESAISIVKGQLTRQAQRMPAQMLDRLQGALANLHSTMDIVHAAYTKATPTAALDTSSALTSER